MNEDLVLKERKIYVLKDEKLRAEVIWLHHDMPAAGHGGKMEDSEVSNEKLLVAGSNKGCWKVCGRV